MFCANTRPRYQVSIYRTIGPLVFQHSTVYIEFFSKFCRCNFVCFFVALWVKYDVLPECAGCRGSCLWRLACKADMSIPSAASASYYVHII